MEEVVQPPGGYDGAHLGRSGTTFYKPDVRHACCPHYTIRLDAQRFRPSKSQRQVVNSWNRYLLGNEYQFKHARLGGRTREVKTRRRNHFDLVDRVHEGEYGFLQRLADPKTGERIEPEHSFEINLEADHFTEEKFKLFQHYQTEIHKEKPARTTRSGFRSFLCSGMPQSTLDGTPATRKIGSHHQCYRVDGRLAAVAVLDLLPHAVSSVYFMYHTDFSDFALGRLSAMMEVAMTIEEGYGYYYMGYYIHSCPKMRYKKDFHPTYVLDPQTLEWNLLDQRILEGMSDHRYYALSRFRNRGDDELSDPDEDERLPPAAASVFKVNIPGIVDCRTLSRTVPLSQVLISFDGTKISHLNPRDKWTEIAMMDPTHPHGVIAELLACVGTEIARNVVILFNLPG